MSTPFIRALIAIAFSTLVASSPSAAQSGSTSPTLVTTNGGTGQAGGFVQGLWANVAPGTNPASTGLRVRLDTADINGGTAVPFIDQVQYCGDEAHLDGRFYGCVSIPINATPGPHALTLTVSDDQGRSSQTPIALTVLAAPDTDQDGLPDQWESAFGLDPSSAAGENGYDGDPDGDGIKNREEFTAGSHPTGRSQRYFAEGASNSFFTTRVGLFNPTNEIAYAQVRLTTSLGVGTQPLANTVTLAPHGRAAFILNDPFTLMDTTYAILVESSQPVVAERQVQWDNSPFGFSAVPYGSTLETATEAPGRAWHFAEGATGGPFSLFYLLQNPGQTPANVTITYFRPSPLPPITKTHVVGINGTRKTIDVAAEDPALASGDVSAYITSDQPIVVERSMYYSTSERFWAAGHAGAGIAAPAARWWLAEGATGFFDEFILVANPDPTEAAQVKVTYLLPTGAPFSETLTVNAQSRETIHVNTRDPRLANTPLSALVESTNTIPIVVERAMWWPTGGWYEASLSAGATTPATKWAVADGRSSAEWSTYLLIANTGDQPGSATVTLFLDDSSTRVETIPLPASSRSTVDVGALFAANGLQSSFSAIVESNGVPIVVERSTYNTYYVAAGPIWFEGGGSTLATRIP